MVPAAVPIGRCWRVRNSGKASGLHAFLSFGRYAWSTRFANQWPSAHEMHEHEYCRGRVPGAESRGALRAPGAYDDVKQIDGCSHSIVDS